MVYRKDLTSLLDQSVWISDDRISALASARCGGIEQINFHGMQPVSRNAKLLQNAEGVLKFELEWQAEDKIRKLVLDWQNLTIHPFGIEQIHYQNDLIIKLLFTVKQNQLSVTCFGNSTHKTVKPNMLKFRVLWNQNSQTKEVHGNRSWCELAQPNLGSILLKATDQIFLWPWLQRKGDYQGDFLIPENWRRMIFKRNCISGTAKKKDIKEEFKKTKLKLYDADTYILIGNSSFSKQKEENTWLIFETEKMKYFKEDWFFPEFTLQLFTQESKFIGKSEQTPKRQNNWKTQVDHYKKLQEQLPHLKLQQFPSVEEFFLSTPQIIESAKVQDYGMTRACPGTYYWIWSWDNMVTAQAMARFGDLSFMIKMVDFLRIHRDKNGVIPGRWTRQLEAMDSRGTGGLDFLFCELVLCLYSETLDKSVLQNNYVVLHQVFRQILQQCNDNGFFPTMGMYPDLPSKMGRSGQDFVTIDAGMWYCFCRSLEKIALILDDTRTASRACELSDRIRSNFIDLFWDEEKEFLCDSVNPQSGMKNESFPVFSLLFMEFPFGQVLLGDKIERCGTFIENNLLSDNGLSVTPAWDINHTSEPVMSAWYPHWDLPATTVLTLAKKKSALTNWLQMVNDSYQMLGYCPEFVALDVSIEERWKHHGAAWNLNCAAGWYNSIIQNIAGIVFDLGGITLRPTGVVEKMSLQKLWFRGGQWNFRVKGQGNIIQEMMINNHNIYGTWKIPSSFYTDGKHLLHIQLGNDLPKFPVLTELWGGEVQQVAKKGNSSRFQIQGIGQTDLAFFCIKRPKLILDDKELKFTWDATKHQGFCQLSLSGKHQLEIKVI